MNVLLEAGWVDQGLWYFVPSRSLNVSGFSEPDPRKWEETREGEGEGVNGSALPEDASSGFYAPEYRDETCSVLDDKA